MIKRYLLLTKLIIALLIVNAQDNSQSYLIVRGTIKVDRSTISGAKADVYENGKLVYTADATGSGKLEVKLNLNKNCEIIVRKIGYFPKKLSFNTKVPSEDQGIFDYRFSMEMVREVDGFDVSFWDEPIGRIMFVEDYGEFDYDEEYTKSRQKRMNAMMKEYGRLLQQTYDKIIMQADDAFNKADYDLAEELYLKAISYDPFDPYPDEQILAIDKLRKRENKTQYNYDKYIKMADLGYTEKDYINAKNNYEKALEVIPEEQYPKDQIALIDKIVANKAANANQLAELEEKYNEAIRLGDQFLEKKSYESSLEKFKQASLLKSEEQYPKDKINELNGLIAAMAGAAAKAAEIEKQYKALIAQADIELAGKNYTGARGKYQQAVTLKPNEAYPPQKIQEIDGLLAAQKGKDAKYNNFISLADQSFTQKIWDDARKNYNAAIAVKPNEEYPKIKLKEIDAAIALLAKQKLEALEANYSKAITQGDAAFNKKAYGEAKGFYNEAIALKTNEIYPKQKVTEIDKILASMANKRKAYDLAISKGDAAFNSSNWEVSKSAFQEALALYPQEQYPQNKINEIDNKLLALKNTKDQEAAREKAYNEAITKADALLADNKYSEAKNYYGQASSVKPSEIYPKTKISEIDGILASLKDLEAKYTAFIESADKAFLGKNYQFAKEEYSKASGLKSNEAYPKQKMTEIDALLLAANQKKLEQERLKAQYDNLIKSADVLFVQKEWMNSLNNYKEAIALMPSDAYPKERINIINAKISELSANEQKYNVAIAKADGLFAEKKYNESKEAYMLAVGIKKNESYPKTKIDEIEGILNSIKEIEESYAAFIKAGDKMFTANSYEAARNEYVKASGLKSNEAYPKQKIAEIDNLILSNKQNKEAAAKLLAQYQETIQKADAEYNKKQWSGALGLYQQAQLLKPNETYPVGRIEELKTIIAANKEKEGLYNQAIAKGDNQFNSQQLAEAVASYQNAIELKPQEGYPQNQLKLAQAALAKMAKSQVEYEKFVKLADEAYTNKDLDKAKLNYQSALAIKPTEAHPKSRLTEINALLADIAKNREQQAKLDAQYNQLITSADQNFNQKKYDDAKGLYGQAAFIKESESYPKERIAEIDRLMKSAADIQKQYDQKIAQGQTAFSAKNLNGALQAYKEALALKPNEGMPKQKIIEISALIDSNQKTQQQYDKLISQADNLFNSTKYSEAKPLYTQASELIASESYPKQQLAKINQLLAEQAKNMAALEAKMEQYKQKIAEADNLFNVKKYEAAISAYIGAKSIKSDETYPDQQIAKINSLIKADKTALEARYNSAMNNGKNLVTGKKYNDAKAQFQQALSIKPGDFEAEAKIAEVNNLIDLENKALADKAQFEAKYKQMIDKADNLFKSDDYSGAKSFYNSALGIKANDKYAKDRVLLCDMKLKEKADMLAAQQDADRKAAEEKAASSFGKNEFDYKGEKRDNSFLNELAKQYPEGKTIENYDKPNKKIKRVIMNKGGIAKEYMEVTYSYGTYYFRNGNNISKSIFYSETK